MSNGNNQQDKTGSFWSNLPAIIKAIAILLPTIGGLLLVLCQIGIINCTPTDTPTSTPTDTPTSTPTDTLTSTPTPTSIEPSIFDIRFCDKPCSEAGAQSVTSFPEKTQKVYMSYSYSGMTPDIHYSRIWTMNGQEWVHYECIWKGPEQGTYEVTLREPKGLRSGPWIITFLVNQQVAQATINIEGSHDYWDPAGHPECPDF